MRIILDLQHRTGCQSITLAEPIRLRGLHPTAPAVQNDTCHSSLYHRSLELRETTEARAPLSTCSRRRGEREMATPLQRRSLSLARPLFTHTSHLSQSRSLASNALVDLKPGEIGIISGIPQDHLRRTVSSRIRPIFLLPVLSFFSFMCSPLFPIEIISLFIKRFAD